MVCMTDYSQGTVGTTGIFCHGPWACPVKQQLVAVVTEATIQGETHTFTCRWFIAWNTLLRWWEFTHNPLPARSSTHPIPPLETMTAVRHLVNPRCSADRWQGACTTVTIVWLIGGSLTKTHTRSGPEALWLSEPISCSPWGATSLRRPGCMCYTGLRAK